MKDGEVVAERHRFDNRLTMAILTRLDQLASAGDDESRAARYAAQEFEQYVRIVAEGGEGAAEFIASRELADAVFSPNDTARNLARLESYRRHGEGLREEFPPVRPAEPADGPRNGPSTDPAPPNESPATDPGAKPEGETPRTIATWLPPTDE